MNDSTHRQHKPGSRKIQNLQTACKLEINLDRVMHPKPSSPAATYALSCGKNECYGKVHRHTSDTYRTSNQKKKTPCNKLFTSCVSSYDHTKFLVISHRTSPCRTVLVQYFTIYFMTAMHVPVAVHSLLQDTTIFPLPLLPHTCAFAYAAALCEGTAQFCS